MIKIWGRISAKAPSTKSLFSDCTLFYRSTGQVWGFLVVVVVVCVFLLLLVLFVFPNSTSQGSRIFKAGHSDLRKSCDLSLRENPGEIFHVGSASPLAEQNVLQHTWVPTNAVTDTNEELVCHAGGKHSHDGSSKYNLLFFSGWIFRWWFDSWTAVWARRSEFIKQRDLCHELHFLFAFLILSFPQGGSCLRRGLSSKVLFWLFCL